MQYTHFAVTNEWDACSRPPGLVSGWAGPSRGVAWKLGKSWDWIGSSHGELLACVFKMSRQILKGFGLGMHKETPLEPAGVSGWYPGGRSRGSPWSLSRLLQWWFALKTLLSRPQWVYSGQLLCLPISLCSAVVPAETGYWNRITLACKGKPFNFRDFINGMLNITIIKY